MPTLKPYIAFLLVGAIFTWFILMMTAVYDVAHPIGLGIVFVAAASLAFVSAPAALFRPKVGAVSALVSLLILAILSIVMIGESLAEGFAGDALFGVFLLALLASAALASISVLRRPLPFLVSGTQPRGVARATLAGIPLLLLVAWLVQIALRLCSRGAA